MSIIATRVGQGIYNNGITPCDPAGIQRAINACLTRNLTASANLRVAKTDLVFPAGTYILKAPLQVLSVGGLRIRGEGPETTLFVADDRYSYCRTTVAAGVAAGVGKVVTPAAVTRGGIACGGMTGITLGCTLRVNTLASGVQEDVVVTAVTSTTFTATFTQTHGVNVIIRNPFPAVLDINASSGTTIEGIGLGTLATDYASNTIGAQVEYGAIIRARATTPPAANFEPPDLGYSATCEDVTFRHVKVYGDTRSAGIQVGSIGNNLDEAGYHFDNVRVLGDLGHAWQTSATNADSERWRNGWRFGTGTAGNCLNHSARDIRAAGFNVGVNVYNTNADLSGVVDCDFNEVDLLLLPRATFQASGTIRSEGSRRFVHSPGQGTASKRIAIRGAAFDQPAASCTCSIDSSAGQSVHLEHAGTSVFEDCVFTGTTMGYQPTLNTLSIGGGSTKPRTLYRNCALSGLTGAKPSDVLISNHANARIDWDQFETQLDNAPEGVWYSDGHATVAWVASPTTYTIDLSKGNAFDITATSADVPTFAAPIGMVGRDIEWTLRIVNTSGGVMGAPVFNGVFKMPAFTRPASTKSTELHFRWDGTSHFQVGAQTPDF